MIKKMQESLMKLYYNWKKGYMMTGSKIYLDEFMELYKFSPEFSDKFKEFCKYLNKHTYYEWITFTGMFFDKELDILHASMEVRKDFLKYQEFVSKYYIVNLSQFGKSRGLKEIWEEKYGNSSNPFPIEVHSENVVRTQDKSTEIVE